MRMIDMLTEDEAKALKAGDRVTTSLGTGFVVRVGEWAVFEEGSLKDIPCIQVELDGGGLAWIDYDKCAKP